MILTNSRKERLINFVFIAAIVTMFFIVLQTPMFAQGIGEAAEKAGSNLVETIKSVYNGLFPFLLILNIAYLGFFAKDQRGVETAKKALIWVVAVYIAVNGIYYIKAWVDGISSDVLGTSSTP